jgi:hypothetical protein
MPGANESAVLYGFLSNPDQTYPCFLAKPLLITNPDMKAFEYSASYWVVVIQSDYFLKTNL